jgi:hypothetical protein
MRRIEFGVADRLMRLGSNSECRHGPYTMETPKGIKAQLRTGKPAVVRVGVKNK